MKPAPNLNGYTAYDMGYVILVMGGAEIPGTTELKENDLTFVCESKQEGAW